jgi:hypothetical protein
MQMSEFESEFDKYKAQKDEIVRRQVQGLFAELVAVVTQFAWSQQQVSLTSTEREKQLEAKVQVLAQEMTPDAELRRRLLDSSFPKTELEHYAARIIIDREKSIWNANEEIARLGKLLEQERS